MLSSMMGSPMRSALLAHWTDEETEAQGGERNVPRTHGESVLPQSSLRLKPQIISQQKKEVGQAER